MAAHDLPDRSVLAAELAEPGVAVAPEQISTEVLTHNPRNQITEGVWIVRVLERSPPAGRCGSSTLDWDLLDNDEAWRHPVVATGFPDGLGEGAVRNLVPDSVFDRFVPARRMPALAESALAAYAAGLAAVYLPGVVGPCAL